VLNNLRELARGKPLLLVATLAIGCISTTEIPRSLPTALTVSYGDVVGDSSVATRGDSVIATTTLRSTCGSSYGVRAGNVAGELMIVVTDSSGPMNCALVSSYRTLRVAVAGMPAGRYLAQFDYEAVVGTRRSRSILVRQAVSVR